jgi:hypothetical protein
VRYIFACFHHFLTAHSITIHSIRFRETLEKRNHNNTHWQSNYWIWNCLSDFAYLKKLWNTLSIYAITMDFGHPHGYVNCDFVTLILLRYFTTDRDEVPKRWFWGQVKIYKTICISIYIHTVSFFVKLRRISNTCGYIGLSDLVFYRAYEQWASTAIRNPKTCWGWCRPKKREQNRNHQSINQSINPSLPRLDKRIVTNRAATDTRQAT